MQNYIKGGGSMTHLLLNSNGHAHIDETRSTMQHNSVGSVASSQMSRAVYDPHTGQVIH